MRDKITISVDFDDESRGQVGIGTLIVFIAMVLVAAIAAGVLINTAGFLQTKSEQTGQQSASQVTNNVDVISKVGEVQQPAITQVTLNDSAVLAGSYDDANISAVRGEFFKVTSDANATIDFSDTNGNVFNVTSGDKIKVTTADTTGDGSAEKALAYQGKYLEANTTSVDSVDANHLANITFTSPAGETLTLDNNGTAQETLTALGGVKKVDAVTDVKITVKRNAGSDDIDLSGTTINYIGPDGAVDLAYSADGAQTGTYFGVQTVKDDDDSAPVLSSTDDRFTINVKPTAALLENDELEMKITTDSGATKTVTVSVPQSLSGESAVQL